MAIELFQFQQQAASQIADRFLDYHADPIPYGRGAKRRDVPFYQALSSWVRDCMRLVPGGGWYPGDKVREP